MSGEAKGTSFVLGIAKWRNIFSASHLRSAERFAEALAKHEIEFEGAGWGPHFAICADYGSAALVLSFAAIEASVAEAATDLHMPAAMWKVIERSSTIDQAQAVLAWRGAELLDLGKEPVQGANTLRLLRNALVHPKSEWNFTDKTPPLARVVLRTGVPLSPFAPWEKDAFPHGCMSAAFARWASKTAREFIEVFQARVGLLTDTPRADR